MPTERIYATGAGANAVLWLIDQATGTAVPLGALTNTNQVNSIARSSILPGLVWIMEPGTPSKIWSLDPSNGNLSGPVDATGPSLNTTIRGAIDPANDDWYVSDATTLYRIDNKNTAPNVVVVGPTGLNAGGGDMVFDSAGNMFASYGGSWYSVNKTTGAHTFIGTFTLAGAPYGNVAGVFIDADTGVFYGFGQPTQTVYTFNPATGVMAAAFGVTVGTLTDFASSGLASDFPSVICPDFAPPGELTVTTAPIGAADVQAGAPFLVTLTVDNVGSGPVQNAQAAFTVPAGFTYVAGTTTLNGTPTTDITGGPVTVSSPRAQTAFPGVVFNGSQNTAVVTFQLVRTTAPLTDTNFPLGNVVFTGNGYSPECLNLTYNVPAAVLVQGLVDIPPFATASDCDTTAVELCHHEAPVLVCIGGNPAYMHAAYDRNGNFIPPSSTQFPMPAGVTNPDGSAFYRTYFTRSNGVLAGVTAWVDGPCVGDYEYEKSGYYICAAGVTLWREDTTTYLAGANLGTASVYTGSNGAIVAAPATFTVGQCSNAGSDVEIIERLVCAAGVTLVRRETVTLNQATGVSASVVTWFGLDGAAVGAPATFTEGACDDQDVDVESEQVCAAGTNLTRRRILDGETGALISETFIGSNGAVVATPAVYTQGECQTADVEIKHDIACAAGVQVLREQVWTNGVVTATNWFGANGAVIAAPAAFTWGACNPGNDTEIVERLVCAAGVTLVQRTLFTNGVAAVPTYFGVNGAAVGAPAAFTEGACDDQDIDIESEQVCAANVTLTRRRIVDGETGVLISEQFIGNNGAVVAAPAAYTQGVCPLVITETTHDLACAAGVQVIREQIRTGGAITATNWFGANGAAIAAPAVFTFGPCPAVDTEVIERFVCSAGVTLVQRTLFTNGVAAAPVYFGLNGAAVAAPAAFTEGACDDQDIDLEVEYVCVAGVTMVRRRIVDGETGVLISETFVTSNGTVVAAPAVYTIGQCATGLQIESDVCQSLPGAPPVINYYDGLGGGTLPSIAPWGTTPSNSEVLTNGLRASVAGFNARADNYSARSRGYLIAPATGAFTFFLSSDDAGFFGLGPVNGSLNSVPVSISNAGYSGAPGTGGSSFTVNLVAGQYYPFEMGYSEGAGGDYIQVDWTGPGIATRTTVPASAITSGPTVRQLIRRAIIAADGTVTYTYTLPNGTVVVPTATSPIIECPAPASTTPNTVGSFTALRCGATSNATTTATVTSTRVTLENDVILTKTCPTTSALSNNIVTPAANAAVAGAGAVPANARSVTVYNATRARISFDISSHGTITIPPGGTWSGNLPDNTPPYSGNWTVANLAGNAGPAVNGVGPAVQIDWTTRV